MQSFFSLLTRFVREKSPQYFWPLFVLLTLVFLVVFLDRFRSYAAESEFVVTLSGDAQTQESLSTATEEISRLPLSVEFYDRLLASYPEVKDPWADLLAPDRERAWQQHIRTEAEARGESGAFSLAVSADSASDATALSDRVAAMLYRLVSHSYDIRTQVNIQRLDNTTVDTVFDSIPGWVSISLGLGAFFAFLLSSLIGRTSFSPEVAQPSAQKDLSDRIQNMLKPHDDDYKAVRQQLPFEIAPQTPPAAETESVKEEASPRQESVLPLPHAEAKKPTAEPKSAAPSNLPFLAEGMSLEQYVFQNNDNENLSSLTDEKSEGITKIDTEVENTETPARSQEPTEEELKRRLNQLLRGEL